MSFEPSVLAWPAEQLGDALAALALAGGLAPRAVATPNAEGLTFDEPRMLHAWLEQAASYLGLEVEPMAAAYNQVVQMLLGLGPALLYVPRLPGKDAPCVFALVRHRRRRLAVLRPDRSIEQVPVEVFAELLGGALEALVRPEIDRMLEDTKIGERRRANVRRALLREWLGAFMIENVWVLRSPPGTSLLRQCREAGLLRRVLVVLIAEVAISVILGLAWWTIGRGVLEDQLDPGWLLAWGLLLVTVVPIAVYGSWSAGRFAIDAGTLLKRRLLAGALKLEPEEVRHEGAGRFLGRVIESGAVELLALGAGQTGITSLVSWTLASVLLAEGAGGGKHLLLFVAWTGVSLLLVARYYRRRRKWTDARLALTHDLVERMGGHRTRLAQEDREHWHDEEDEALARYVAEGEDLDRSYMELSAFLPRGWFVIGVLGLIPAFVTGAASTASFAVAIGGVLLAGTGLEGFTSALTNLAAAMIASRRVAPLFRAAAREEMTPPPLAVMLEAPPGPNQEPPAHTVMEAHEIVFRHRARGLPILQGVNLRIAQGDRILLEGPSGGGKSTLSSLLAGLRAPESGLLLLKGFDRPSTGTVAWRRRVVMTPQFHENHVLQNTFAFNLLMGRRWPPSLSDLAEAETVCRQLGLGELLHRMPSGLEQIIGETGWQLSHGERSRLYIARALLQGADVMLFDESFGALDPETLGMALRCVLARVPTLLVIAHP